MAAARFCAADARRISAVICAAIRENLRRGVVVNNELMRRHTATRPPQSIGHIIPAVIRDVASQRQPVQDLQQGWERLVGKELAAHTRPARLRGSTLYVQTDDPGANYLFSLEKPRILAAIRSQTSHRIDDVIVRTGELA